MSIPMRRWTIERDFLTLKKRILDVNQGLNFFIARTNSECAAFDIADYGHIITLNRILLPGELSAGDPGGLFTMTGSETVKNYDPYVMLTLMPGGLSLDSTGPSTTANMKLALYLGFTCPINGDGDTMAIRYIDTLKQFIDATRWQDHQPRRANELEIMDYAFPGDSRSWREVGISIGSNSASI